VKAKSSVKIAILILEELSENIKPFDQNFLIGDDTSESGVLA